MVKKREPSPHVYPLPGAPFIDFYLNLSQDSELKEIVDEALDVLKGDKYAGRLVAKDKTPRIYIQKFGIANLYKMNLRRNYRLTYTLVTKDGGVCPHIIEVMTHPEHLRRFGYKGR